MFRRIRAAPPPTSSGLSPQSRIPRELLACGGKVPMHRDRNTAFAREPLRVYGDWTPMMYMGWLVPTGRVYLNCPEPGGSWGTVPSHSHEPIGSIMFVVA